MTVTEQQQVDLIKANALDERRLLEVAFCDCVAEFAQGVMVDRSASESLKLLANWQRTFSRLRRQQP